MQTLYADATTGTITAYLKDSPVRAITRKNTEVELTVQSDNYVIIPPGHRVRVPTGLTVEAGDTGYVMQTAGMVFSKAITFCDPLVVLTEGELIIEVMNISEVNVGLYHGDKLGDVVTL